MVILNSVVFKFFVFLSIFCLFGLFYERCWWWRVCWNNWCCLWPNPRSTTFFIVVFSVGLLPVKYFCWVVEERCAICLSFLGSEIKLHVTTIHVKVSIHFSFVNFATLNNVYISSRLDYRNSLLHCGRKYDVYRQRPTQDYDAHIRTYRSRFNPICPTLQPLHWFCSTGNLRGITVCVQIFHSLVSE